MPTIAVVEANEGNRFVISRVAGDLGEIAECATGLAAIEAFQSVVPDAGMREMPVIARAA